MILRPYKRIKELEEKIRELEIDYCNLKKERAERLRKENEGLHNPNFLCNGCKSFLKDNWEYGCKLDCKCKDREELS